MDIQEFARGLRAFDPALADAARAERLADAIAGLAPSPYLDEASRTTLPGRAFESYYWNLLPRAFVSEEHSFVKHCLLNFAVQQLSVRALWWAHENQYIYAGSSPADFAASLIGAPNFLPVCWLNPDLPQGAEAARRTVENCLAEGWVGNVRSVTPVSEPFARLLSSIEAGTCGLICLENGASDLPLDSLLAELVQRLSPGGTALIECETEPGPVNAIPDASIESVLLPSRPHGSRPHFIICRRNG